MTTLARLDTVREETERIDRVAVEPLDDEDEILTCRWHPKVETTLRCYQCETPICVRCARRTPVGYLCPDCQRGHRRRFEQARVTDYIIAAVAATVLGGVASILTILGAWWFLIFLSPLAGTAVAGIVWRLVGRRYGQHLWWIVSAGIIVGALPALALEVLPFLAGVEGNLWSFTGLLSWGLHVVLAVGSAIARLRMT